MARRVIRFIFIIIGAAVGYYVLPYAYQAVPFQVPNLLNNAVAHFIIFGIIFYFLAVLVEDYILELVYRGEEFLKESQSILFNIWFRWDGFRFNPGLVD